MQRASCSAMDSERRGWWGAESARCGGGQCKAAAKHQKASIDGNGVLNDARDEEAMEGYDGSAAYSDSWNWGIQSGNE